MKKTLLSLGTLSAIVAPVVSVIACGDGDVPGHEAPYSITIQADKGTTTQANVFVDLKGFVTDSYLKEIKSRIAESIVAANKDSLKYTTMKIYIGDPSIGIYPPENISLLINTTPLTDANKNDLNTVFNLIDKPFDDFMKQIKIKQYYSQFFQKDIWQNLHHQIDKVDQDELKKTLLKYLGFTSTDPNTIDFTYRIISDKYIDFKITRTNVVSNPELHTTIIADATTGYPDFLAGEVITIQFPIENNVINLYYDKARIMYLSNDSNKALVDVNPHSGSGVSTEVQIYKIAQFLLKANGYDNIFSCYFDTRLDKYFQNLTSLASSKERIFGYGSKGEMSGVDLYPDQSKTCLGYYGVDFDKKTFSIQLDIKTNTHQQWIFAENGDYLVVEPTSVFKLNFEGTYELNDAGDAVETISSMTKSTATYGNKTIHILGSSSKNIVKAGFDYFKFFRNIKK